MTIKIKLADSVFTGPSGVFYGTPPNRAVYMLGSGREDMYLSKFRVPYPLGHLSYRGGQTQLMIDRSGTEVTDDTFEVYMQNQEGRISYGEQILTLVVKGFLEVLQDGVILTPAQIDVFTA
jgi:hypothetical protein